MLKITHIHSRNIYQGIQLYGPLIKLKIITVSLVKFLSFLATQEGWKVEVRQGNQSLEIHPQKKKKILFKCSSNPAFSISPWDNRGKEK